MCVNRTLRLDIESEALVAAACPLTEDKARPTSIVTSRMQRVLSCVHRSLVPPASQIVQIVRIVMIRAAIGLPLHPSLSKIVVTRVRAPQN